MRAGGPAGRCARVCLGARRCPPSRVCHPSRALLLAWSLNGCTRPVHRSSHARFLPPGSARFYLGCLLYDRRRYEEAVAHWEAAVAADPAGLPSAWRCLGIARFNIRSVSRLGWAGRGPAGRGWADGPLLLWVGRGRSRQAGTRASHSVRLRVLGSTSLHSTLLPACPLLLRTPRARARRIGARCSWRRATAACCMRPTNWRGGAGWRQLCAWQPWSRAWAWCRRGTRWQRRCVTCTISWGGRRRRWRCCRAGAGSRGRAARVRRWRSTSARAARWGAPRWRRGAPPTRRRTSARRSTARRTWGRRATRWPTMPSCACAWGMRWRPRGARWAEHGRGGGRRRGGRAEQAARAAWRPAALSCCRRLPTAPTAPAPLPPRCRHAPATAGGGGAAVGGGCRAARRLPGDGGLPLQRGQPGVGAGAAPPGPRAGAQRRGGRAGRLLVRRRPGCELGGHPAN